MGIFDPFKFYDRGNRCNSPFVIGLKEQIRMFSSIIICVYLPQLMPSFDRSRWIEGVYRGKRCVLSDRSKR